MSIKMIRQQFQKEIKKGTGKAILLMKENPTMDFSKEILCACFKNLDYDPQCSGSRGLYLYEMIQQLKNREAVETKILNKLQQPKLEYWGLEQLFEIAKLMAQSGNTKARRVMYKKYEQLCKDGGDIVGNYEIIALDGLQGLAFIAELHGKMLLKSKESWEDGALIQYVNEELEEKDDPDAFLQAKARRNKYIKAYLAAVADYQSQNEQRKLNVPTYEEIRKQIDSNKKYSFYSARRMSLTDIRKLAKDFRAEGDSRRLINYLKIFVHVKYPDSSRDIIRCISHKNKTVQSWAIFALKHFRGNNIRAIVKRNFENAEYLWETFHLLKENYRISDTKFVEKLLLQKTDKYTFHSMGMSIIDVFKKFGSSNLVDSMLILYNKGYCSGCRHRLIKNLIDKQMLPDWLAKEAVYDCDMEIRILAKNYLKHYKYAKRNSKETKRY